MKDKRIIIRVSAKDKIELQNRAKKRDISLGKLIRLELLTDYTNV